MNTICRENGLRLISLGALATTLVAPTFAQEAEQEATELEEVIVTGSYLYTGVDSPSPVTVITGETLRELPAPDLMSFFFDNVTQNFSTANIAQTEAVGQLGVRSIRSSALRPDIWVKEAAA